jgi:hypothetical protein
MWIVLKKAVSDQMQDSDQRLQISVRSGGIKYLYPNYLDLVNAYQGFQNRQKSLKSLLRCSLRRFPQVGWPVPTRIDQGFSSRTFFIHEAGRPEA